MSQLGQSQRALTVGFQAEAANTPVLTNDMSSRDTDRLVIKTVEAPPAADIVGCAGGLVKIGLVDGSLWDRASSTRRRGGRAARH